MVVLSTGCIIINESNEVLLINSKKQPLLSSLILPGSTIKANDESISKALIRAVKETANIDLKDITYYKYEEYFNKEIYKRDVVFLYVAKCLKKDIDLVVSKSRKVKEHTWVGKDNIDKIDNIQPLVLKIVKEYLDTI